MSERGPDPAQPEGAPPAALGWYARMERQSPNPPTQAASPSSPSARTTPMTPVSGPRHPAPPRKRRAAARTGPSDTALRRRRPSAGLVWWTLGVLVLAAALLAIVLTNPEVDGTTASDSQQEETTTVQDPTDTPGPATSTPGGTENPTSAPATTGSEASATATEPGAGDDPLGLGVAMTSPACDGTWIVILGSATNPASYASGVTALLSGNPEAKYVLTQGACSSLRQQTADGDQIYAVYLGPYPDQASACAVSTEIGGGVYVKRMDDRTPPEQTWEC